MKSAAYGLLTVGVFSLGLLGSACVSGDTVGTGGRTGSNTGNGGQTGGGVGVGGFIGAGVGGFVGAGVGGFVGGGAGGFVGSGVGGSPGGGQAGSSGTGVSGCPRSAPLIDNFDEPNRGGPPTGGYFNVNCGVGSWFVYGDTTAGATSVPPLSSATVPFVSDMPGNGGAGYAAHVNATGYSAYGVGLGVNVNSMAGATRPYDASAYSGFTFWAKGTATSTNGANMVRVSAPTSASSSAGSGGTCTAVSPMYCDGHWGKVITLTANWTQYTIRWADLTLDMNSVGGTTFSPNLLIGFHWQANGAMTPTPVAAGMNMWIDDLAFVP